MKCSAEVTERLSVRACDATPGLVPPARLLYEVKYMYSKKGNPVQKRSRKGRGMGTRGMPKVSKKRRVTNQKGAFGRYDYYVGGKDESKAKMGRF